MLMSLAPKRDRKKERKREGEKGGRAGSGIVGEDILQKLSGTQAPRSDGFFNSSGQIKNHLLWAALIIHAPFSSVSS